MNEKTEKLSYGEIARCNGIKYEAEVCKIIDGGISALRQVNKYIPINLDNVRIELISNKKVKSIVEKKQQVKVILLYIIII